MSSFMPSLERILHGTGKPHEHVPAVHLVEPEPPPHVTDREAHRRDWFAGFAQSEILPRLKQAAEAVEQHGGKAKTRLETVEGKLLVELEVIPTGLPAGARAPRLTISLAKGERPLSIDITGTFPHAGVEGGFGAEIDYDAIYPNQLEHQILEFLALVIDL
jgi:hypothetical protein